VSAHYPNKLLFNGDQMKDSMTIAKNVALPEEFGYIMEYRYLPLRGAVLCQCDSSLVLISLDGDIILSSPIEEGEGRGIVAINEDDVGWQVLLNNQDKLTLLVFTEENEERVYFETPEPGVESACWSPCGNFIAIGHTGESSVSVCRVDNGKQVWTRSLNWDVDDFMLGWPLSLTVSGWSADGKYIVTSANLVTRTIVIWCADSGEVHATVSGN
jgi:WD40 repeat protein